MKQRLFWISLAINALLVFAIYLIIQRLGGWRYALHRFKHTETALYQHRKDLFSRLPEQRGAIIFVGDSQTAQNEWSEWAYSDSIKVLNRGIVADQTGGVLERLQEVIRHQPSSMFLCIGINDLLFGGTQEGILVNYRHIVERIRRESPQTTLFLQSVLPVNPNVKQIRVKNTDIVSLNAGIEKIAAEYAIPYIDLYTPLTDADGNLAAKFTEDGLHLNGLGYQVWKNTIKAHRGF